MTTIQIKAYLLKEDSKMSIKALEKATEIRRFSIENDSNGLYKNLIEKIMQHFKSEIAHRREIKAYYMDNENDFIGFSSDSELQFAIDLHNKFKKSEEEETISNPIKVYIIRRKISAESFLPASKLFKDELADDAVPKKEKITEGKNLEIKNKKKICHNLVQNFKSSLGALQNSPENLKQFREHIKSHLGPLGMEVDIDDMIDDLVKKDNNNNSENNQVKITDSNGASVISNDPNSTTSTVTSFDKDGNKTTTVSASSTTTSSSSTINNTPIASAASIQETSISNLQEEDGFNMVDIEKEVRIMKAVESLKSMGFDDENNWLTAIVTAKDGKINDVLDALSLSNPLLSKH